MNRRHEGKRDMIEIGKSIFESMSKFSEPVTMTRLQEEINTGYNTLTRYIDFIQYIQNMPSIGVIAESKRAKFVSMETMPLRKDMEYVGEMFPAITPEQQLLVKLDGLKDIPTSSLPESEQNLIKSLEKKERITITNKKINLTPLGRAIAKGAKRVYSA